jgi:16S rRNA (adenine1518-N6/adenine1519-N6)-dimethyltransferase
MHHGEAGCAASSSGAQVTTAATPRIRPRKALGQRFLHRASVSKRIVSALDPQQNETVVEIGPGRGALTEYLIGATSRLILIEVDPRLAASWRDRSRSTPGLEVVEGDARELGWNSFSDDPVVVVGNLPYHITADFLSGLFGASVSWSRAVVMVQAEVADRLAAPVGSSARGAITLFAEYHASVEKLFTVPRTAFRPVPAVAGGVIRLIPHDPPVGGTWEDIRPVVRAAFGGRRKRIANALSAGLKLPVDRARELVAAAGVDTGLRPAKLSLQDFDRIARLL